MVVVLGIFFALIFGIPDRLNPTDPPFTIGENALRYVCGTALWPFLVTSLILGQDPPRIGWLLLWIVTGFFWGFMMELVCIAKHARKV